MTFLPFDFLATLPRMLTVEGKNLLEFHSMYPNSTSKLLVEVNFSHAGQLLYAFVSYNFQDILPM